MLLKPLSLQVFGQALIPGAAMLEAALSAAHLLAHGSSLGDLSPALLGVSIPAPLMLSASKPATMECVLSLSASAASVSVQSNHKPGQASAAHLQGLLAGLLGENFASWKRNLPYKIGCILTYDMIDMLTLPSAPLYKSCRPCATT